MEESLHYLLMTDYLLFQKAFLAGVKETNLTPGQPKILDYLLLYFTEESQWKPAQYLYISDG